MLHRHRSCCGQRRHRVWRGGLSSAKYGSRKGKIKEEDERKDRGDLRARGRWKKPPEEFNAWMKPYEEGRVYLHATRAHAIICVRRKVNKFSLSYSCRIAGYPSLSLALFLVSLPPPRAPFHTRTRAHVSSGQVLKLLSGFRLARSATRSSVDESRRTRSSILPRVKLGIIVRYSVLYTKCAHWYKEAPT